MLIKTIDASVIKKCFLAGAGTIDANKEKINDLNVFPVPDGDTGTNMTMTIMSAAGEVSALEDPDMESLCKAISSGSLRGARGNSGVILSQLLRGFTKEIKKVDEVDVIVLTRAFERAVESAYKAVMKPKEGTILTVARAGAEKAVEMADETDNLAEFVNRILMHMHDVLEQTPDMLPVLKEAGVVDSGGAGLMAILQGAYDAMIGKEVAVSTSVPGASVGDVTRMRASTEAVAEADIRFGYCTEFIIMLEKKFDRGEERAFKSYLESIGDSIVCVADDDIVKIHVHTNDPGLAIQKALTYGSLTRIKIDNMREEHNERVIRDAERKVAEEKAEQEKMQDDFQGRMPQEFVAFQDGNDTGKADPTKASVKKSVHKKYGFISVSAGAGLSEVFHELGVDVVIEGGQTMNPSTDDILNAVEQVDADTIYVLPNNSNIILAAEQARDMTKDKKIVVIPSKNIPEGVSAMISFVEGVDAEENEACMTGALSLVKAGQVTYAVRDTVVDGKEIKSGDIMGLSDKKIEVVGSDITETTIELLKKMMNEHTEIVTIYYGEESTQEDAQKIADAVTAIDDEVEVEVQYGGQPIYYYLVSVEE